MIERIFASRIAEWISDRLCDLAVWWLPKKEGLK